MEFRLLGRVEARTDAGPVELGTARQKTVLAALLMDVDRPVTADQLVHRVWGDGPPQRATQTLYGYVSRLRRLLPGVIARKSGGYVLTADASTVDVHRFRHLVAQARQAGDDTRAVALFQEGLALWHGEPFAGADTPWFNTARDALREERRAAEADRTDVRLRLGEHAELLVTLAEHSTRHPLDERLAAQYMLALYRCGRQADALAHYRRLRGHFAEELGIDPGQELQRLHQAILGGDAELSAPTARTAVRRSAEAVWTIQCQLPPATPDFTGRAEIVRRLEELLTPPAAVPVVVSGSPGVGKSALAAHLGHRLRPAFPDGQWYVRLLGASGQPRDPDEVLAGLLRSCGQEADTIPQALEDRAAAFRSRVADRRVLLILDDAADAEQIRPLLPGTSGVGVLVTSRRDLRGLTVSHAARTVPLDVLPLADAITLLTTVLGEPRVAAEPESAALLAELCARLPLALRIAAANLAARPGRSLAACAEELAEGNRLTELSVRGDRQTAVRTAFDRSHTALEPAAARLFALLGLVPGPDFDTEAAAVLLDAEISVADRLLDHLVTVGLVQRTAAERFQFHDLLRLYAAEHAAADPDHMTSWQRLCDWYLATADAATAFDYVGTAQLPRRRAAAGRFTDRHQALAWLETERVNLVAVITRAAQAGPYRIAWQLADQLRPYFYRRRHNSEWETATAAGLRAAEHEDDVRAQAAMHHGFFLLRQHAGDTRAAWASVHVALAGYRSTGFTEGEGAVLINLALHYGQRGQMRHALGWQKQSTAIARSSGQPLLLGRALNMEGLIHSYLGELDSALQRTTEAIEVLLRAGHQALTISPRINRAIVHHALGQYDEALADGTEALRLCHTRQQRHSVSGAHEILARIHRDTARPDLADTHAAQALQVARATADPANEVDCLITLGSLHQVRGRLDLAAAHLEEALRIARRCDFRHQQAEAHIGLADVRRASGDSAVAVEHAELALTIARELELRPTESRALTALADVEPKSRQATRGSR